MHEVAIITHALDAAVAAANEAGARRIAIVRLRIGRLVGVVPEALEFAFEVVRKGTLAEDAALEWTEVPVECRCRSCGRVFSPEGVVYACPDCGELSSEILSGRELELTQVEIE